MRSHHGTVVVDVLLDELEVLDELLLDEVLLVEVEPKSSRQHPWSLTASLPPKKRWLEDDPASHSEDNFSGVSCWTSGRGYFGKGVPSLKLTAN